MSHLSGGRARWAALGVIVVGFAVGGIAYASIPDAGGVIHGCYQKNVGNLRVIDASTDSCRPSEVALNWNQTGPTGLTGPTGAPGATGPSGFLGSRVVRATVSVPAHGFEQATARCSAGEIATGGGYTEGLANTATGELLQPIASLPTAIFGFEGWGVQFFNTTDGAIDGVSFAVCVLTN